ncbi:MAG: DEAD/DEAH box helicase [Chitinophagaceae bacterium]|nr:DEAD/DEAH box helicase [Chitinophagaceae bacterium]
MKTGLLWEPENLHTNKPFLSLLTITKKDGKPFFRQDVLSKINIDKLKSQWSRVTFELMERLCVEENRKVEYALHAQEKKYGSNTQAQEFIANAIEKHRYEQIRAFFSIQSPRISPYHKIINPKTGKPLIEPCQLSQVQPVLSFDVVKERQRLNIQPKIVVSNKTILLKEMQRFEFMLLHETKWYVLSLKDSHTLDWLGKNPPIQYGEKPELFAEKILTKLEENYTVNRNDFFTINEIKQQPECEILFTELNDSFLMLTPRWNYDGFVVEDAWKETKKITEKGIQYIIYRDQQTELNFIRYIQGLHPNFPAQASRGFYFLSFENARKKQWFLGVFRELLNQNIAIVGLDMLRHFRYSPNDPYTEMEITNQTPSAIELHAKVCFGKEEVPLLSIQKMLLNDQRNVLLKDDSIAMFGDEWAAKYALTFKHATIYKNRMTIPVWVLFGQANEAKNNTILEKAIPDNWRKQWFAWQNNELTIPIPETITTTLRPYQQKGFEWLVLLSQIQAGACLADDMGLGKTLQAICLIAYQQHFFPEQKSIVVCPASLIYNWEQEIQKFAPSLKPFIYRPQQGQRWENFIESGSDIIISSYGALRSDIGLFKNFPWQVAIIDESQNIKNPSALITRAVYELQAQNRIALSGTPVMNNTFDLYAQLQFLLPGLLGNREFFKKEYANPIDRNANNNKEKINALRQLTAPFILRRTKRQVATDLPEKTESILWCEMPDEQKRFYEEIKSSIRDSIFVGIKNNGLQKSTLNILQGILKLRQVCDSPMLIKENEDYTPCKESIKIDRLIDELTDLKESGNKALVFSQFTGMLNLIAERCTKENIDFYHFDGNTAIEKRNEMVTAFQKEDDTATAFLISLKTGNAGLNLTNAQYVYLVDPWWNRAVEQQAIDRTHRIGQHSNVFAYRMICRGSIEEKVIALQERKKSISDELVAAEENFVKTMTEEDLKFLFS